MKYKRFIAVATLALVVLSLNACCTCKNIPYESGKIKGSIVIIGNEPFSKLALKTDDDNVYILKCKPDVERELWKKQGNYYQVTFSKTEKGDRAIVLVVDEIVPININTK
ncbi:hypothetical protein [Melioribacter sp. OK-6-Me]|uniref:hypothetical protein n=1 Tax=unclassified Melioribacter TaxID=2627329 RepID=UPI003EDA8E9A